MTHLLLATLITGSLDAGLPLLLIMVPHHVVVAILAPRTTSHHTHGAPLPLGATVGTDTRTMSEDLAPDGDGTVRTHGGGRTAIPVSMCLCLNLNLGGRG